MLLTGEQLPVAQHIPSGYIILLEFPETLTPHIVESLWGCKRIHVRGIGPSNYTEKVV